jgi:hypothetical protein
VKGLQGNNPNYWKTASLMKHFLANSNENNRTCNSSDFDEQLFREYYSYAFYPSFPVAAAECIKAGITVFLDDYRSSLKEAMDKGLVSEKEIDEAIYGNF